MIKVWAAHDCGRALNPLSVEGQIIGSYHMGLGQVLTEEMKYAELEDYLIKFVIIKFQLYTKCPKLFR